MAHYIDAEKLIAEIERHIKEVKEAENRFHPNLGFFDAKLSGIYDTLSIIYSLQQEQPEVDLEKEIDNYLQPIQAWQIQEAPFSLMENCARHFAEWGLNARKEEK